MIIKYDSTGRYRKYSKCSCFLPLSWLNLPAVTTFDVRYRGPWGNLSFFRVLGTESEPATEQENLSKLPQRETVLRQQHLATGSLCLLFLRLAGFHADPADFQNWFGRIRVPVPEGFPKVLPDRVPGVSLSFPGQTNFQQVADIVFSKHQEGVGQVQANDAVVAEERTENSRALKKKTLGKISGFSTF